MSDSVLRAFGARVRALRKATGKTQEVFATEAGFDRNFLGRVERGSQNVSISTLVRIAAALDVSISDLFAGVELGEQGERDGADAAD